MANYTLNYSGAEVDRLLEKIDTAFGEETGMGDTITWDGVVGDRQYIDPLGNGFAIFCHVSDATPTLADFANRAILMWNNGNGNVLSDSIVGVGNGVLVESEAMGFFVIPQDNMTVTVPYSGTYITATFPVKGLYFGLSQSTYPVSLKIIGYTGFEGTKINTINEKYLPDTIFYVGDDSDKYLYWDINLTEKVGRYDLSRINRFIIKEGGNKISSVLDKYYPTAVLFYNGYARVDFSSDREVYTAEYTG